MAVILKPFSSCTVDRVGVLCLRRGISGSMGALSQSRSCCEIEWISFLLMILIFVSLGSQYTEGSGRKGGRGDLGWVVLSEKESNLTTMSVSKPAMAKYK